MKHTITTLNLLASVTFTVILAVISVLSPAPTTAQAAIVCPTGYVPGSYYNALISQSNNTTNTSQVQTQTSPMSTSDSRMRAATLAAYTYDKIISMAAAQGVSLSYVQANGIRNRQINSIFNGQPLTDTEILALSQEYKATPPQNMNTPVISATVSVNTDPRYSTIMAMPDGTDADLGAKASALAQAMLSPSGVSMSIQSASAFRKLSGDMIPTNICRHPISNELAIYLQDNIAKRGGNADNLLSSSTMYVYLDVHDIGTLVTALAGRIEWAKTGHGTATYSHMANWPMFKFGRCLDIGYVSNYPGYLSIMTAFASTHSFPPSPIYKFGDTLGAGGVYLPAGTGQDPREM
jgi:hypothetical protein